jgi:adenylate cyclase
MPQISHYEVYTLEESGWVLHARFPSSDKAKALDEARAVDAHLRRPAKVVRESYDPATNRADDQTVFLSGRALDARRRAEQARTRGHAVSREGLRPNVQIPEGLEAFANWGGKGRGKDPFSAPSHAKSTSDLVARVTFVVVASLIIATAGTALIPAVINLLRGMGIFIGGTALSSTLFAVFMVLFLTSGFFLTARLVPMQGVVGRPKVVKSARPKGSAGGQSPSKRTPEPAAPAAPDRPAETATQAAVDPPPAAATAPQPGTAEAGTSGDKPTKDTGGDKGNETAKKKDKKKDEKAQADAATADASPDDTDGKAGEPAKEAEDPDEPDRPPGRPEFEASRTTAMGFLSEYVTALKQIRPRLDTYNRFGINLYLAGVCETLAKQASLTHAEFKQLLQESVEIMGTRAAQAESFVTRLNSYLEEDRYGQMVQCGREAMARKQAGGADPFANLGMVVEEWNTPKTQKVSSNTIAIVFTDLVGSTDMTSEFGDQMAQDILRAHNSAVRSALGRFSGKEIKHTGDGIMATFDHVPDAVAGMIDVLRAVRAHNEAQPRIPLRIRIGINAGEPISAENDYYGLAVTIAARVCAKADMDQILVSQVVRDMCEGTDLTFADRGSEPLKGIKAPQHLHEALWEGSKSVDDTPPAEQGTDDAEQDAQDFQDPEGPKDPQDLQDTKGTDGAAGRDKPRPEPVDPEASGWLDGPPRPTDP